MLAWQWIGIEEGIAVGAILDGVWHLPLHKRADLAICADERPGVKDNTNQDKSESRQVYASPLINRNTQSIFRAIRPSTYLS